MTNEIPLNLYLFMLGIQFILLLYSLLIKSKDPNSDRIDILLASAFSAGLGWLNANMILNGNIVERFSSDVPSAHVISEPVQSLPLHYFLLAVAIVSTILIIWFVIDYFRIHAENNELFTSLGGDLN